MKSIEKMNEYIQEVVDAGRNIFITGAGGVGKSWQTQRIIDNLLISGKNIQTCAFTGVAALNIGGSTLHSLLGQGLFEGSVDYLASRMISMLSDKKSTDLASRWIECQTLIIDEISMMDVSLFIRASEVIKRFRQEAQLQGLIDLTIDTSLPWGGIQIILVGDFLQLPPVQKFVETLPSIGVDENGSSIPGEKKVYTYLFEHPIWEEMCLETVYLTEPKRYDNIDYFNALGDIRLGILSDRVRELLKECSRPPESIKCKSHEGNDSLYINPTILYATNREVDTLNNKELDKLKTREMSYKMEFSCSHKNLPPGIHIDDMTKHSGIPEVSRFRIGCQVMLTKNMLDMGLCNGSRGVVIGFDDKKKSLPIVEFDDEQILTIDYTSRQLKRTIYANINGKVVDDKQVGTITYIPLKLAYAITVHKSQGASISSVFLSASSIFAPSMLYVALSRCKSREHLYITGYTESIFKKSMPNKSALEFYENLSSTIV